MVLSLFLLHVGAPPSLAFLDLEEEYYVECGPFGELNLTISLSLESTENTTLDLETFSICNCDEGWFQTLDFAVFHDAVNETPCFEHLLTTRVLYSTLLALSSVLFLYQLSLFNRSKKRIAYFVSLAGCFLCMSFPFLKLYSTSKVSILSLVGVSRADEENTFFAAYGFNLVYTWLINMAVCCFSIAGLFFENKFLKYMILCLERFDVQGRKARSVYWSKLQRNLQFFWVIFDLVLAQLMTVCALIEDALVRTIGFRACVGIFCFRLLYHVFLTWSVFRKYLSDMSKVLLLAEEQHQRNVQLRESYNMGSQEGEKEFEQEEKGEPVATQRFRSSFSATVTASFRARFASAKSTDEKNKAETDPDASLKKLKKIKKMISVSKQQRTGLVLNFFLFAVLLGLPALFNYGFLFLLYGLPFFSIFGMLFVIYISYFQKKNRQRKAKAVKSDATKTEKNRSKLIEQMGMRSVSNSAVSSEEPPTPTSNALSLEAKEMPLESI